VAELAWVNEADMIAQVNLPASSHSGQTNPLRCIDTGKSPNKSNHAHSFSSILTGLRIKTYLTRFVVSLPEKVFCAGSASMCQFTKHLNSLSSTSKESIVAIYHRVLTL
jgi:hypothetical protein